MTYKCRAECSTDIARVMKAIGSSKIQTDKLEKLMLSGKYTASGEDIFCGEMEWTFTINKNLKTLKKFIRKNTEDTHIILDTIELVENYTGVRKYTY